MNYVLLAIGALVALSLLKKSGDGGIASIFSGDTRTGSVLSPGASGTTTQIATGDAGGPAQPYTPTGNIGHPLAQAPVGGYSGMRLENGEWVWVAPSEATTMQAAAPVTNEYGILTEFGSGFTGSSAVVATQAQGALFINANPPTRAGESKRQFYDAAISGSAWDRLPAGLSGSLYVAARAALGDSDAIAAANAAGLQMNAQQWNSARALSGKPGSLFVDESLSFLPYMSASQYVNALGLSGLGGYWA